MFGNYKNTTRQPGTPRVLLVETSQEGGALEQRLRIAERDVGWGPATNWSTNGK